MGPTTTEEAATPESVISLPVVPEREAKLPEVDAPAFDTMLSAVRVYVGPAMDPLR